jgi:hypothetical protein
MFTDEKLFTLNGGLNKQNDRVYANSRNHANKLGGTSLIIHLFSSFNIKFVLGLKKYHKFPLTIMVWIGITVNGATEPYFLEPGNTKIIYI